MDSEVKLHRQINLFQAVSICVGYMIGSGIFVSPYGVVKHVGSVGMALLIWMFCGLFNMLGALCYAELGTTISRSGGEYTYILAGLGRIPAFITLWTTYVLVLAAMTSASALIFATYILSPFFAGCEPPIIAIKIVAGLTIMLLACINSFNVNWAAKVQVIFAFSAVLALVVIIGIGFYAIFTGQTHNLENAFEGSKYSADSIAVSFYSGFWAYSGWNSLNSIAGELQNPSSTLPRAIIISIALVTVVYVLTNVAYLTILSVEDMLSSAAVAITFAQRTLGSVALTMPVFVACAIIGTVNGGLLAISRMFFVGAQDGNFPSILAMISYRYKTPAPAIIAIAALSAGMCLSDDIFYLIELVGFALTCIYIMTFSSMIYLRITQPNWDRPIKLPLILPIFLLLLYSVLLLLTVYRKPFDCVIAFGIMLAGLPLYLLGCTWEVKPKWLQSKIDVFTSTLQKLLLVVPQQCAEGKELYDHDS